MPTFRRFSVLLSLAVASLLFTVALPVAHGQTLASTASFSGSVSDSTGARLPNAKVTLNNPEKGITRTFTTDPEGNFSFALLPAGTYTLTVEAAGFKTSKQTGITLEVGQSANQSIALTIGSVEQIEVLSTIPLLQVDNANIGSEISQKQVTELPLNLRNVFNFVELNSSVNNLSQRQTISSGGQQGSADQDVSFFNFGGGYFGTTAFLLDGAWDASEGLGWRDLRSFAGQRTGVQGPAEHVFGAIWLEHWKCDQRRDQVRRQQFARRRIRLSAQCGPRREQLLQQPEWSSETGVASQSVWRCPGRPGVHSGNLQAT